MLICTNMQKYITYPISSFMKVKVGQCWHMNKSLLPQSTVAICDQELRSTSSLLVRWHVGRTGSNSSYTSHKLYTQTQQQLSNSVSLNITSQQPRIQSLKVHIQCSLLYDEQILVKITDFSFSLNVYFSSLDHRVYIFLH